MKERQALAPDDVPDNPAFWDWEQLHRQWLNRIQAILKGSDSRVPPTRVRHQVEQTVAYREIVDRWPESSPSDRLRAWKTLLVLTEESSTRVLPVCVQCGECCRKSSPSLYLQDLDLLREGKIPWDKLYTIRRGEPVRSPDRDRLFHLLDERVKIQEKTGSGECVFLDSIHSLCTIYPDRPLQCRAQVCWDPDVAAQFANEPYLTRRDLFQGVEILADILAEHDRRCGYEKLRAAFQRLGESKGDTIEEVLDLLGYESHFREFFSEKLSIPPTMLPLVFGRSFGDLVVHFGFRVREDTDGSRILLPDP
ncbi:MAG TPA: YkgJ family cysteine cluster protein [Syntrophobacteraceae bacterium]|nr:YkgJ family cysteine cluster protein [Syntrophobacteraceae bacterium]